MSKIKAGIIGGAGYTGGEVLRLLLNHPEVEPFFVQSRSAAGRPVAEIHSDLFGETSLLFTKEMEPGIDVVFLCLGHGESREWLHGQELPEDVCIIDLSQDFRHSEYSNIAEREFVYGLPEYDRERISKARNIANPGCFATAIQLSLLPLAAKGLLQEVHITGVTGSTGAGQKPTASTHFSWRANNIQPYKTLQHQHLTEVRETLKALQPSLPPVHFIPWRGAFPRGILTSSQLSLNMELEEGINLYKDFYFSHPFTHLSSVMIDMKQVVNTNKCLLHIEKVEDQFVIHAAIDNLLKGAAGQAVQNMNLLFGFPETTGLKLKPIAF
jgi:N-acetyl-gamma-glutamyl-phosphate reductase